MFQHKRIDITPSTRHTSGMDDLRERYEERAAIMEFDGKMPRAQAEALAWREVYGQKKPPQNASEGVGVG